jgi:predicted NUDIX family phosphoesterase
MEFVYVVEREKLWQVSYPHGFVDASERVIGAIDWSGRMRRFGFFVQRDIAEYRPEWKQVIPYCVIRKGDMIWVMTRGDNGGEERLRGSSYIGVGGHVNPCDVQRNGRDVWFNAMQREIEEEAEFLCGTLKITRGSSFSYAGDEVRLLGYINDDTNPVGAVHFGLVYEARLPDLTDINTEDEGRWMHIDDVLKMETGEFESWTKLIIDGAYR